MAHMLENINGKTSFVSARKHAWHQLGTVLDKDGLTADEAIILGGLDWEVLTAPLKSEPVEVPAFANEEGVFPMFNMEVAIPDRKMTYRINPGSGIPDVLGVVGRDYHVIQNREHATFLQALVDNTGAIFQTAGSIRDGKQFFISMLLPDEIQVGGVDRIQQYLVATGSHDGSRAMTAIATNVRVVCANTCDYALKNAPNKFSIKHTSGAAGRVQDAREALQLTFKYQEAFAAMAEQLFAEKMSLRQFEAFTGKLFGDQVNKTGPNEGKPTAQAETRKLELKQLFTGAETNEIGRGTRWGALQTVVEYLDWVQNVKGEGNTHELRTASGVLVPMKEKAVKLLTV